MQRTLDRHPWLWLVLGSLATITGHLRWGIDILAWLAPILWLRYLASTKPTWRSRAGFVLAFVIAWNVAVLGIVTPPLTPAITPMFGVPIAVLLVWPYLVWAWLVTARGQRSPWSTLAFPALMAVAETLAHTLTPFGVWGQAANAALSDLPLLQLAALTGGVGVGFVLHWLAAALEACSPGAEGAQGAGGVNISARRQLWLASAVFIGAHVVGGIRLNVAANMGADTVTVATVGTDCEAGGLPLPSAEQRELWDRALFDRTRAAAQAGAELVVWTEAASIVDPVDEEAWLARVGELAHQQGVAIVAGYVVPVSGPNEALLYENAYALLRPDGELEHRYLKHHPVPGEPAIPGTGPTPMWSSELLGEVSGAICYDYDFPAMARARSSADIVALPSSDWRGIDPIHSRMAQLRAIEGGHSVLRSTRFGLSVGIDPTGVIRGQLSHFDDEQRVLVVHLPREGRRTVYGLLGEWFALCSGLLALLALVRGRA